MQFSVQGFVVTQRKQQYLRSYDEGDNYRENLN